MNLKTVATLAAALIAGSTAAVAGPADQKCGAGSCGKKEVSASSDKKAKDASCSKKEASCAKKEGSSK
jgi:hypothetical protein